MQITLVGRWKLMSDKKLVSKLAKVMQEVKYIEKKGYNKFNRYKYATESDVSEKIREVLSELNVIMLPDVVENSTREHTNRKGHIEYIATVKVKFTFIDGDTGEELSIHSVGEGQDAGDKGYYKAITGAHKYALMKAFMIPTGDDPEEDGGVGERNDRNNQQVPDNSITQEQIGTLKSRALKLADLTNVKDSDVFIEMKINDVTKLNKDQAIRAIGYLDNKIKEASKNVQSST